MFYKYMSTSTTNGRDSQAQNTKQRYRHRQTSHRLELASTKRWGKMF